MYNQFILILSENLLAKVRKGRPLNKVSFIHHIICQNIFKKQGRFHNLSKAQIAKPLSSDTLV